MKEREGEPYNGGSSQFYCILVSCKFNYKCTCEYLCQVTPLLCLEPSMAPSSLRVKAQVLPRLTRPCTVCPGHLPAITSSYLCPHSLSSGHTGILAVLEHTKHVLVAGPLHRLFLCQKCSSPETLMPPPHLLQVLTPVFLSQ